MFGGDRFEDLIGQISIGEFGCGVDRNFSFFLFPRLRRVLGGTACLGQRDASGRAECISSAAEVRLGGPRRTLYSVGTTQSSGPRHGHWSQLSPASH